MCDVSLQTVIVGHMISSVAIWPTPDITNKDVKNER